LQKQDYQTVNKYIDKNAGLYIIYSDGAMPQVEHVYAINKFKTKSNKAIESFIFKSLPSKPIEDMLPNVVCESTPYNKEGIFGSKVNVFAENPVWEYTDLNEKEKQAAQFASQNITYTIINTHDYVYCFGELEGEVKLLFLDLRIPCSA
jgi:hypothetical protein